MIRIVFLALLFAAPSAMAACQSDADCDVGSHCAIRPGQGSGMCSGGMLPALPNDRGSAAAGSSTSAATRCAADADCGFGGMCRKAENQVYGSCVGGTTVGIHPTPH